MSRAIMITGMIAFLCLFSLLGCTNEADVHTPELLEHAEKLEKIAEAVESKAMAQEEETPTMPEQPVITDSEVGFTRINIKAFQFGYEPDKVEVGLGEEIMLTVTSIDVGHGFALPDFGINDKIPPEESKTFTFTADKQGEFRFFNSVYSGEGWKDMEGVFVVR